MVIKEVIDIVELVDRAAPDLEGMAQAFLDTGIPRTSFNVTKVVGETGEMQFVDILIPGRSGRAAGGDAPTIGVISILGGTGARPYTPGLVSDGDGAVGMLAALLRIARMRAAGDLLDSDVRGSTHILASARVVPHDPVPHMRSHVDGETMVRELVDPTMDIILSVDTSRGNRIVNANGVAITPTVKDGWILRVSEELLTVLERVTGRPALVMPITMQDITPYDNGVYHVNGIMMPCALTRAPVVGIAVTAAHPVPGVATGVSSAAGLEELGRFIVETIVGVSLGRVRLFDPAELGRLVELYGDMHRLVRLP